jgi:hypothetical protein
VLGSPRDVTPPWSGEPHDHPVPGVDHLEVIHAEVLTGEAAAHGDEYLVAIVADEVILDAWWTTSGSRRVAMLSRSRRRIACR